MAIDRHGAIGCQNRLPWSIKTDMSFFRHTTLGKTVIMGRKTFESIGGCLKGRTNLILSHNDVLFASTESCRLTLSVDEALAFIESRSIQEAYVVGGAATYLELAPFVDRYLVTFVAREILEELKTWPNSELASHPADPGRDEFPFRIVEFVAPNAAERCEQRTALANQLLAKRLNAHKARKYGKIAGEHGNQVAFQF
jgi:dihydrofolate reductase